VRNTLPVEQQIVFGVISMTNRVLASLVGWISAGFCALLVLQGSLNIVLISPLLAVSVGLIILGMIPMGSGKRFIIPAVLIIYCATILGTLTALFFADAPMVERALGAILMMAGALATLRALYVATRRRRNSMRDYYDR
jgi:hypothetical protein